MVKLAGLKDKGIFMRNKPINYPANDMIYKITGDDNIIFFSYYAAENHLIKKFAEYLSTKDQMIALTESMIYSETKI